MIDWFSDRPVHFVSFVAGISIIAISMAFCMSCISSCAAKTEEARYKYKIESDKVFWERKGGK